MSVAQFLAVRDVVDRPTHAAATVLARVARVHPPKDATPQRVARPRPRPNRQPQTRPARKRHQSSCTSKLVDMLNKCTQTNANALATKLFGTWSDKDARLYAAEACHILVSKMAFHSQFADVYNTVINAMSRIHPDTLAGPIVNALQDVVTDLVDSMRSTDTDAAKAATWRATSTFITNAARRGILDTRDVHTRLTAAAGDAVRADRHRPCALQVLKIVLPGTTPQQRDEIRRRVADVLSETSIDHRTRFLAIDVTEMLQSREVPATHRNACQRR
jgi:hypothetical protein